MHLDSFDRKFIKKFKIHVKYAEIKQKPYISVVISAYNRKSFLMNAINSVLNQTLNKDLYEIIVIKNFKDRPIDDFIRKHKITEVFVGSHKFKGFMQNYYLGVIISRGDIITFLDDDDEFYNYKLKHVYDLFNEDNDAYYYHNDFSVIGKTLRHKIKPEINIASYPYSMLKFVLGFNNNVSSISLKKFDELPKLMRKLLNTPEICEEALLSFCILKSKKIIIDNATILTRYRVHSNNSTITNDYSKKVHSLYVGFRASKNLIKLARYYKNTLIKNWIEKDLYTRQTLYNILISNKRFEPLLFALKHLNKISINRLILCGIYVISPAYAKKRVLG